MSQVEFTEETQNQDYQRRFSQPIKHTSGSLTKLVQKWGIVKNEKSANYFFIIVICICVLIIYILNFRTSSQSNSLQANSILKAQEAFIEAQGMQTFQK